MISKSQFIEIIDFIKRKNEQENTLCDVLESLSPGSFCDCFLYSEYEEKLRFLLEQFLNDKTELISYKLYEFDQWSSEERRQKQLLETPEVESWETVYDYLIQHLNDSEAAIIR